MKDIKILYDFIRQQAISLIAYIVECKPYLYGTKARAVAEVVK